MLCENCLELLLPYLENELDDTQKAEFEAHLQQCESCQSELTLMQSILSCSSEIGQNPPKELTGGVMKKIKAEKRRKLIKILSPTAVAAVLVVAVGLNFSTISSLFGSFDSEKQTAGSVKNESAEDHTTTAQESDNAVDGDRAGENFAAGSTSSYDVSTSQSVEKSSLYDNSANAASKGAAAPELSAFLPYSAAERYSIKSTETFRYGVLVKASDENKLTGRTDISVFIKSKPSLYVSTLTLTELENLLGDSIISKTDDSTKFSGLNQNATYGFIILEK